MYACLSARMEQLGSLWTDFDKILYDSSSKLRRENLISFKSNKKTRILHEDVFTFMTIPR
jgi:hypothetical protein